MGISINRADNVLTASIIGEIDHHSAKNMREEIDSSIENFLPKTLELDFKKVTFMDSSGIGLVMGRYKLMQNINGKIKIINLSNQTKKVMRLAGLDKLATIEN